MQDDAARTRRSAYGRVPGKHNARLTEVGPGTPAGELFRRFWIPLADSRDASARPRKVRALGEDLILYRDKSGRPGLLYPHCAHRGSSLFYGRIEERGIRCCYHGWLFTETGRCIDQPCEPEGGLLKDNIQQPWYPVQERYGMIFAYMGPPDRMPILPRYEHLENLEEGEMLEVDDQAPGSGSTLYSVPCNWLQHYENTMDPHHFQVLHVDFATPVPHFTSELSGIAQVSWDEDATGMRYTAIRELADGRTYRRITQVLPPAVRVVAIVSAEPGPTRILHFLLPVDDTNLRTFMVTRVRELGKLLRLRPRYDGRLWGELTEDEHQVMPGDYEAQVSQGPIQLQSEENLRQSDRGVAMMRRLILKQIEAVEAGKDPAGLIFDPAKELVRTEAGNYFERRSEKHPA